MDTRFSVNTFDPTALPQARAQGLGLEVDAYLWTYPPDALARMYADINGMMRGFTRFSFHGTAVSRDVEAIAAMPEAALLQTYNQSYAIARRHGIDRIVFHTNYLRGRQRPAEWVAGASGFWRRFLSDKPAETRVYLENFIDDTPELLAALIDAIEDARAQACLDTGHALCNSAIPVTAWIETLGARIGHAHLHNNDGTADKHWPLSRGLLDFREVLACLFAHTGDLDCVLECGAQESIRWLTENGFLP